MSDHIRNNIAQIRGRIDAAAARVGRNPSDVTLVAVSKTIPVDRIIPALDAGITNLGENRVQEAESKVDHIKSDGLKWHLIGPLQSNKAKRAVEIFDIIHSVDSIKLAERLDRLAGEMGKTMPILIQVDLGKEATKSGVEETDLEGLIRRIVDCGHLSLDGLMTLPPYFEKTEEVRPYFRRLRELMAELNGKGIVRSEMRELSMGMSHDFEIAIEEGATMVRVGTAIFGGR